MSICFLAKGTDGVEFLETNWSEVRKTAKSENKLIFLDLYATWCGPCKVMDKSVFSKDEVGDVFNSRYINARFDAEKGEGELLAEKFGVSEYPTYLFLNAEGDIVYKIIGYHSPVRLLREADAASKVAKTYVPLNELETDYENGNREPTFLFELIERKYQLNGSQDILLEEYLKYASQANLKTEKVLQLIANNVTSIRSKGFDVLLGSLDSFLKMTESQQKSILDGISKAKILSFKKAVNEQDETLFEELIKAVHASAYSKEGALDEERQFRYDFARLTKNFKHFAIIAHGEAGLIMQKEPESFDELDQQKIEQVKVDAFRNGVSDTSPRLQAAIASIEGSSRRAASFQLNEFAYGFYQMTNSPAELKDALKWSAYAIKLLETPTNWQTYALILKKLGRGGDAKKAIKRSIKLAKKEGVDTKSIQNSFKKN